MTTRQHILEILNEMGEATIENIADALHVRSGKSVSSVTIRYHLNVLLSDGKITEPRAIPRTSRGRPQHVFAAVRDIDADKGTVHEMLAYLLEALEHEKPEIAEPLLERMIKSIVSDAQITECVQLSERVVASAHFLNSRGYEANTERVEGGFILYTHRCPYHDIPQRTTSMCGLDMRLIEAVVGQPIQRLMRITDGDSSCAYFIEEKH